MIQRSQLFRILGVLTFALVTGLLYFSAYKERELWKVVGSDSSTIALVGQQRWFGLTGIHLVRRNRDAAGRLVHALVVGHASSWDEAQRNANAIHHDSYGSDSQWHFDQTIRPLVAGIAKGTSLVAYEGLPHQHFERQLLDQELRAGRSIKLHEFPFYQTPVPIKPADADRLSALGSAAATFRVRRGEKACGGFHPDWCLQWRGIDGDYRMLLCFGCCEAKIYGPRNEIYCDLEKESLDEFKAILKPYRTNRPEAERVHHRSR